MMIGTRRVQDPLLAFRRKDEALDAMERTGAPKVRKFVVDELGHKVETEVFRFKPKDTDEREN